MTDHERAKEVLADKIALHGRHPERYVVFGKDEFVILADSYRSLEAERDRLRKLVSGAHYQLKGEIIPVKRRFADWMRDARAALKWR